MGGRGTSKSSFGPFKGLVPMDWRPKTVLDLHVFSPTARVQFHRERRFFPVNSILTVQKMSFKLRNSKKNKVCKRKNRKSSRYYGPPCTYPSAMFPTCQTGFYIDYCNFDQNFHYYLCRCFLCFYLYI